MKCQVLQDRNGAVLAIGYGTNEEIETEGMLTRFGPLSDEGQSIVEVSLSDDYRELPIEAMFKKVQAQLAAGS